jgi:hypothetical protein
MKEQKISTPTRRDAPNPDLSRRDLVARLLGAATAGVALPALSACLASGDESDYSEEDLAQAAQAFTGTQLRWADRYDIPAGDSLKTLQGNGSTGVNVAIARGRSTVGDGGQGVFIWQHGVATGDDGGTIIVPSAAGRWVRIYDHAINVKWFGAKGDGTTDDTAAIQAARSRNLS